MTDEPKNEVVDPKADDSQVFEVSVPRPVGPLKVKIKTGSSVIFVGANGGGKTRLAVLMEDSLRDSAHRISAHRALTLNPQVAKVPERIALGGLKTGLATADASLRQRNGHRWQNKQAVALLNDFDYLI